MTIARRYRVTMDVEKTDVPKVITRAQLNYNGMNNDKVTYASPNPALPAYLILINNVVSAEQQVKTRVIGAAATRNIQRDVLYTAMQSQRMYVQSLADASPELAVALIQNAGFIVGDPQLHAKPLLGLKLGKLSGTVIATANVGLLVAGAQLAKPNAFRFFNWQSTLDGKTFANLPSTTKGTTTLTNLTPLTTVGVRVNLNTDDGPGEWSQVVYILVQ
jgi:hypothetical protein